MKIKKRKIGKWGNSYAVTIPMQYIKDELINKDKEYDIIFVESK